MRSLRRFVRRLANVATRRDDDQRLREEIESHLALLTAENVRAGLSPDEARRQAVLKFGGVQTLREDCRAERGFPLVDALLQDVRYSLRMLRRSPGFTAVAILTFALGIGANAAIFSIVDAVLLRPLAYPHPSQLVAVFQTQLSRRGRLNGVSYQDLEAWRAQSGAFSALAGTQAHQLTLTGAGEPAEVDTISVTADFFSLLRTEPLLGRTLQPADGKQGAAPVVVLSEQLWRSRFDGNPDIVGRSIDLDKRAFTVVGVMPAVFRSPFRPNLVGLWIPLVQDPLFSTWMPRWGGHWLAVAGRLKPGVSMEQAQSQLVAVAARLAKESPATNAGWSVRLEPLHHVVVGNVRTALLVLLGAVGLVLLTACANIANLLLARATARQREMGVRLALGAGRCRIIRQLLTESVLLGGLGGLAGIVLARWGADALASRLPASLPQLHAVTVDGRVLAFALGLSLAASLLFGLAPALLAADTSVSSTLREGTGRAGGGSERRRGRNTLAVVEIALATVLLVGGGLLLRSFNALISVDPGFDARQVWMAEVDLPRYQYSKPAQWSAFADDLLDGIRAQPGLKDSAVAIPLPLADGNVNFPFTIAGNPPLPRGVTNAADYVSVTPGYFHVMKIPLVAGRLFNRQDSASAARVTIISEALARRFFPNENPLGRHLVFGFPPDINVSR
ncbi:MAG TPA: ADOP family duplicated permease, partial [Vicinamibacterales bacterium]|nr:ADOP family duplicated permease [Vicinamibacterales bacterium]